MVQIDIHVPVIKHPGLDQQCILAIMIFLSAYAVNELKMDVASFKMAWNTKMATCSETVAKLSSKEIDV